MHKVHLNIFKILWEILFTRQLFKILMNFKKSKMNLSIKNSQKISIIKLNWEFMTYLGLKTFFIIILKLEIFKKKTKIVKIVFSKIFVLST